MKSPTEQLLITSGLSASSSTIFSTSNDTPIEWKRNFTEFDDSDETDTENVQTTAQLNVLPTSPTKKG